jgi:hypothetical protein
VAQGSDSPPPAARPRPDLVVMFLQVLACPVDRLPGLAQSSQLAQPRWWRIRRAARADGRAASGQGGTLEKHYVPKRSQRARSVLTFFAQDSGTHNLVYANADYSKATSAREVIAFCDHWKQVSGADPKMLVMDQRVTTHQVLGELDERGVKFLTLRMRSPALACYIASLRPADFTPVTLDRAGQFSQPTRPKVHEDPAVTLTSYPGTARQLIITGLGRDTPTVIITNDREMTTRNIIRQYARRMTIEQRLAEIIRAFCADALSSAVI